MKKDMSNENIINKNFLPQVYINTLVGRFNVSCEPNKYYSHEIIIGGKRFTLPSNIIFNNVDELMITQGFPTMGILKYHKKNPNTNKVKNFEKIVIFKEQSFSKGFYYMEFIN